MSEDSRDRWVYHDQLGMFILDILHFDYESIPHLIHGLNGGALGWRHLWPHDFTIEEIVPELDSLLQQGLVSAYREDDSSGKTMSRIDLDHIGYSPENLQTVWFGLSDEGWRIWKAWIPPALDNGE